MNKWIPFKRYKPSICKHTCREYLNKSSMWLYYTVHIGCMHRTLLCTFDGLSLGQDGDCALCHLLLVHNWRDLWAPAVWANPDEMTCLVGLFSSVEKPSAKMKKQKLAWIRSASRPVQPWFGLQFITQCTCRAGLIWLHFHVLLSHLVIFKRALAAITRPYLISSSLAKSMTTLALGFSRSRRMTLSNSPCLGSRGILTDWEMHTPPEHREMYTYKYQCMDHLQIILFKGQINIYGGTSNQGLYGNSSLLWEWHQCSVRCKSCRNCENSSLCYYRDILKFTVKHGKKDN